MSHPVTNQITSPHHHYAWSVPHYSGELTVLPWGPDHTTQGSGPHYPGKWTILPWGADHTTLGSGPYYPGVRSPGSGKQAGSRPYYLGNGPLYPRSGPYYLGELFDQILLFWPTRNVIQGILLPWVLLYSCYPGKWTTRGSRAPRKITLGIKHHK